MNMHILSTDTSGSLNLCTPSSGKDFTREFTSRIHERCQLGQIVCQKATTILDPASGQIKTVLSSTTEELSPTNSRSSSPAKKPSYLNLACCVNGYSNLTTYDSKLRQNINKSREVSPIRPIIHTLQYNRGEANAPYLVVPVPMPIVNDSHLTKMDTNNTSCKMTTKMLSSPDKRYYSSSTTTSSTTMRTTSSSIEMTISKDVTDNVGYLKSSSLSSALAAGRHSDLESPKSFIQQRVERLYGPSALAAGFYSPKRSQKDSGSVLSERSQNTNSTLRFKTDYRSSTVVNSSAATAATPPNGTAIESENHNHHQYNHIDKSSSDNTQQTSLPVLRHLRPEFRAQLPIVSPKRSQAKTDFIAASNGDHKSNTPVELPSSANSQTLHAKKYTTNDKTIITPQNTSTITNQLHSSRNHQPAVFVVDETVVVLPTSNHSTTPILLSSNGTSKATNGVYGGAAAAVLQQDAVNSRVHQMQITDQDVPDKSAMFATSPVANPLVSQKTTNGHGGSYHHNGSQNGGLASVVAIQSDSVKDVAVQIPVVVHNNGNALQSSEVPTEAATNGVKNGLFFLGVLNAERDRLLALAVTAEQYMDTLATVSYWLLFMYT